MIDYKPCESCESVPCVCTALTSPVPWIEAELSSREIEPGVYDLTGASEAVVHEHRRLTEPMCEWFLLCENPATGVLEHPVLGDVQVEALS